MNTTIFTGILLMLIGIYAVVRGCLMGNQPIALRKTFTEIAFGIVGMVGIFYIALGWFIIVVNYNMGMGA